MSKEIQTLNELVHLAATTVATKLLILLSHDLASAPGIPNKLHRAIHLKALRMVACAVAGTDSDNDHDKTKTSPRLN